MVPTDKDHGLTWQPISPIQSFSCELSFVLLKCHLLVLRSRRDISSTVPLNHRSCRYLNTASLSSLVFLLPPPFSLPSQIISFPKGQGFHIPSSLQLSYSGRLQFLMFPLTASPSKWEALGLRDYKYSTEMARFLASNNLGNIHYIDKHTFTCNYLETNLRGAPCVGYFERIMWFNTSRIYYCSYSIGERIVSTRLRNCPKARLTSKYTSQDLNSSVLGLKVRFQVLRRKSRAKSRQEKA